MEYATYQLLQEFQNNFEDDYYVDYLEASPNLTPLEYLTDLSKLYSDLLIESDKLAQVYTEEYKENIITDKGLYDELMHNNRRIKSQHVQILRFIKRKIEREKLQHATKPESKEIRKIKFKGSLQSFGYIMSQLIEQDYFDTPKRNGKINTSELSRMFLEHFLFVDREEQPKPEDIRKTLFSENKLSADKQGMFKIPSRKIINDD